MNLAFNSTHSGLGNNGGSRTIILCSDIICTLAGHSCDVIAHVDNFKWFRHRKVLPTIPKGLDALIAVACTDVVHTLRSNVPVKAWYIRGHENWTMSDKELQFLYRSKIKCLVNSKGLQNLLSAYGADSEVVYQGIDFGHWRPPHAQYRANRKMCIGALYNGKRTKRWRDFVKLHKILGDKDYNYLAFGTKLPKEDFLTYFSLNPTITELRELYSKCHIWFAPTELEGLHNPPMEAALCGCLVVCSDHPLNGMSFDYTFDGDTAMVYEHGDINHAAQLIKNPNWDCIGRMENYLHNVVGTREHNMQKLVGYLNE